MKVDAYIGRAKASLERARRSWKGDACVARVTARVEDVLA